MNAVTSKDCPVCGLINPHTSSRCDCGYEFQTGRIVAPDPAEPTHLEPKAVDIRIMLIGGVGVLTAFSSIFFYTFMVMATFSGGGTVGAQFYLILGVPMVVQLLAYIVLAWTLSRSMTHVTLVPLWVWLAAFAWQWSVMVADAHGMQPAVLGTVALALAVVLALVAALVRTQRPRRASTPQ